MYPLVIAPNGHHIMRINHDASISVQWDKVLDERYKKISDANFAVVKFCEILLAAKDNFLVTSWNESDYWIDRWEHYSVEIEYINKPISKNVNRMTMYGLVPIARICYVGHWHIWWSEVEDIARLPVQTDESPVALIGTCRLMVAAKDRFITKSWKQQCSADE